MSRKFIITLVGMGMAILWAAMKWEISYLVAALGFAGAYQTANVAQDAVKQK